MVRTTRTDNRRLRHLRTSGLSNPTVPHEKLRRLRRRPAFDHKPGATHLSQRHQRPRLLLAVEEATGEGRRQPLWNRPEWLAPVHGRSGVGRERNTLGHHQRGSNIDRRTWHPIRERAGIPESVHFHDLRPTAASHRLAVGVHPKVVQERMGHSDISLTMNTYSHLLSGLQSDAVERLSGLDLKPRKKLVAVNGGSKTDLSDPENHKNTAKT